MPTDKNNKTAGKAALIFTAKIYLELEKLSASQRACWLNAFLGYTNSSACLSDTAEDYDNMEVDRTPA
jgi:hypothetical protein